MALKPKASGSLLSKENMALWKDVLGKKEGKIAPPSLGPTSAALVSAITQTPSTYINEAPSRDTNGFSAKYQALQGETGAGRGWQNPRADCLEAGGGSTAALDLLEVVFLGFMELLGEL